MDRDILGLMGFGIIIVLIAAFVVLAIPAMFLIGIIIAIKSSKKEEQNTNRVDLTALEKLDRYNTYDIVSDIRKSGSRYVVVGEDIVLTEDASGKPISERVYHLKASGDKYVDVSGKYLRKVKEL